MSTWTQLNVFRLFTGITFSLGHLETRSPQESVGYAGSPFHQIVGEVVRFWSTMRPKNIGTICEKALRCKKERGFAAQALLTREESALEFDGLLDIRPLVVAKRLEFRHLHRFCEDEVCGIADVVSILCHHRSEDVDR